MGLSSQTMCFSLQSELQQARQGASRCDLSCDLACLHGAQLDRVVQQAPHAAVQLPVVVRLNVEHKVGVGHAHVPLEGQVERPAPRCMHIAQAASIAHSWQALGHVGLPMSSGVGTQNHKAQFWHHITNTADTLSSCVVH